MAVEIKSFNELLGTMIRKILADSSLNDLHTGSVLLSLLEAAATNDFENNAAVLSVLELINIDTVKNNDLDARAADLGLSRVPSTKATGFITITDSNITKRTASLYPGKPPPISGSTVIFVNDAEDFEPSGSLYIGRNTTNFEGPISYTSIDDFGTFFGINLVSALENDHLVSEIVVDAQGTIDRLITAGTIVKIPANNQNPEIQYVTLRDAVIPAGEDTVDSVAVIATRAGSFSNAGVSTITEFDSDPFSGAEVINTNAFTDGSDIESDDALRNRIKSYASTLARGTRQAILTAIIGVSDTDEDKQVASAVITEPIVSGDPSIIYLDDGSGFQPSFIGQSVDVLLNNASGKEEFLQLANFPLPRPQAVNSVDGPYQLIDNSILFVLVDGVEETVVLTSSDFVNISSATTAEIAVAINDQAELFKCRLTENSARLLLYPTAPDAETIQVSTSTDEDITDVNDILRFPTNEFSHIRLYQNNTLLKEKLKSATLTTVAFSQWNITSAGNLVINVDNTPSQDRTFQLTDFGVSDWSVLTLEDWVTVVNTKYAGITAESTAGGNMRLISNKQGSGSALEIVGGTLFNNLFEGVDTETTGQASDFELNRQNGNLRILTDIEEDDVITAGTEDAKGNVISEEATVSGTFTLSTDGNSRPPELVIVADASRVISRAIQLTASTVMTITDEGSDVMRIMASTLSALEAIQPLDYIYITNRGDDDGAGLGSWLDIKSCGLYQIIRKGNHLTANVDSFVEVKNVDIVAGSYTVQSTEDMVAFTSDKTPQVWSGSDLPIPAASPIQDIVDSLNDLLVNVIASIFKTNFVKLTSSTEEDGSIAIPVSVGNARLLFGTTSIAQTGNPSHIANKQTGIDLITYFKRTEPIKTDVFLDRFTYAPINGGIDVSVEPGIEGTDPFSEEITSAGVLTSSLIAYDNIINFVDGHNRNLYRSIREILSGDKVGTQFDTLKTGFDHISGSDTFNVFKMLEISDLDNLVLIMDQDAIAKTIDLKLSRTGRVNSGSQAGAFTPSTTQFSADDVDNEPGIDFGSPQAWSKTENDTEFRDYAVWFRARNWYVTGGVGSGGASFLMRNLDYGPTGQSTRFTLEYPNFPETDNIVIHENSPENTLVSYFFGSGAARTITAVAGMTCVVSSLGSDNWRYDFSGSPFVLDLSTVIPGDILSLGDNAGVSAANSGRFSISAVNDIGKTIDVYNPNGSAGAELITLASAFNIFPLAKIKISEIVELINSDSEIINAVAIGDDSLEITIATREEVYTPAGPSDYSDSLAFGHDPDPGNNNHDHVKMYDSETWVKIFENTNPNFTVKQEMVLPGVASTIYKLDTAPDPDTTELGESFKLVPRTVTNILHHLTQKALTQLPIVSDVYLSDFIRKLQIKSLELGSTGAVEVVGGRGNDITFSILGDAQLATASKDYLEIRIPSSPNALSAGDHILIDSAAGTNRFSRLQSQDSMDVILVNDDDRDYRYNPKDTFLGSFVRMDISDVSVTYGRAAGMVWRWQHSDSGAWIVIEDKANGAAITLPDDEVAGGGVDAPALEVEILNPGSATEALQFRIAISAFPTQADYFTFETIGGATFAVWLDIDAAGIVPTGATYLAATNKIEVDIVTGDSDNDIIAKIFTTLGTVPAFTTVWNNSLTSGATFIDVNAGDLLTAYGSFITGWDSGNLAKATGTNNVAGLPIIAVDSVTGYVDVVNPDGRAMASTVVGNGNIIVTPTPIIKWNLAHSARAIVNTINVVTGTATANTAVAHQLNVGDTFTLFSNNVVPTVPGGGIGTVLSVTGFNTFTFATSSPDGAYPEGFILSTARTETRYSVRRLGLNGLIRIQRENGGSPRFLESGVAVDDIVILGGNTFKTSNRGEFRVLGVENDSLIIQNETASDELHTLVSFNDLDIALQWTSNGTLVTGVVGAFKNLSLGDWIKKIEDDDTEFVQVIAFDTGVAATATSITLGDEYSGTTSTSQGVAFDQLSDVNAGILLQSIDDIVVLEGDSVRVKDTISITEIINPAWFGTTNTGTYTIDLLGTNGTTYKPFLRVYNPTGLQQTDVDMSVDPNGFRLIEHNDNKFSTIRKIDHIAIDDLNSTRRTLYVSPANRVNKFSESNRTRITALGKMNFTTDLVTGVDGYLYYIGLLRTVQRIVDGFEPDIDTYPGRKGIGGFIELLPPLIKQIAVAVDVTTNEGVNLNEITNEIKSIIINYVQGRGVGEDVILSEIIAQIMTVSGVAAVTFTTPTPDTERISVSDNEKAFIESRDISIS